MRYVDRSKVRMPACLDFDVSSSKARKELAHNLKAKKRLFRCYKDDTVKYALESLFHGKCAYCETRYNAHHPVDIEHYRPKNSDKYWWLAAVWENLLPSCIDCNRVRRHKHFDYKLNSYTRVKNSGKGCSFPVIGTRAYAPVGIDKRASSEKMRLSIVKEQPILLNPTLDNVDNWFSFNHRGAILPSPELKFGSVTLERVEKTIRIIGLNRLGLVSSRNEVLLNLEFLIYIVKEIIPLLKQDLSEHHIALLHELLVYIFRHIKTFEDDTHPYSTMCRQIIKKKLAPII
ncbi:hypothetical protein L8R85_25425 [Vibrio splendidus]|uniref:HNH nuclease domain-containing protein n=1 Tax=Vibrio splendidus TaxID=29497 RepID=A0AA43G3P2_VIBSP|nr:hypothetical protein [Vibrio splendidus]MDH5924343.1 hypothetical protein [Vibrio splendidus]